MRSSIGKSIAHESALNHVTGRAQYIDDLPAPDGTLHAALVLSTIAHGNIESINTDAVLESSGVVDLLRLADIPGITDVGPIFKGDPILTESEIQFYGQPILVVLATTERAARAAALKASITYKTKEPVLTIDAAKAEQLRVRPPHRMTKGDAPSVLAKAPMKLKNILAVGGQEHLYLEGQVALATPTEDGGVIVQSSTQHPTEVQTLIAEVLDIPFHQVVVEVRRMGGAFGGKESQAAPWACIAAMAAVKTGRPVKLRLPRSIDMQVTGKRHPFENSYEVAFDSQGKLLAADIEVNGDCGCSPDLSDAIVDRAMFHADNAYHFPAMTILGERWKTHKVSNTAFRGFGGPQGVITAEALIDDVARAVNRDPLDVRMDNLYLDEKTVYGQPVKGELLRRLVAKLRVTSDYDNRRKAIAEYNSKGPRFLKGLALTPVKFGISFTATHLNQAGVLVHIYTDGSILVSQAGTEMGQGLYTKVAQIVAAVLGVSLERVKMSSTRTDKVPNTSPTAASSGTDLNGMAAKNAAIELRQRLIDHLVVKEGIDAASLVFAEDKVTWPEGEISFAALVKAAYMERIQLSATGFYKTPKIWYDHKTASGNPFLYFAYGAACSEVTIDQLTGVSTIERVDIIHDTGASLNPALDIGQIEGAFAQGAGWLTSEELKWDAQGRLATQGASTYKIPAISDRPKQINIELMNEPNSEATVFHSKAVGEPPFMLGISVWCAIRDAISSLSGYRTSPSLPAPATPEAILNTINATRI
jgi:xanthine dehydrogenase large subunit